MLSRSPLFVCLQAQPVAVQQSVVTEYRVRMSATLQSDQVVPDDFEGEHLLDWHQNVIGLDVAVWDLVAIPLTRVSGLYLLLLKVWCDLLRMSQLFADLADALVVDLVAIISHRGCQVHRNLLLQNHWRQMSFLVAAGDC